MFYKFFNKKINDFRWYYWDYIIKNKLQLHFYFYILEMKLVSLFYILNDSTEHITKTFIKYKHVQILCGMYYKISFIIIMSMYYWEPAIFLSRKGASLGAGIFFL